MSEWLPSETLPKVEEPILIVYLAMKGQRVTIGHWNPRRERVYCDVGAVDVIAWMPLPAPPETT